MRAAHTASADLIAAPISPVEQAERLAERVHGEEGLVIRCVKKKKCRKYFPPSFPLPETTSIPYLPLLSEGGCFTAWLDCTVPMDTEAAAEEPSCILFAEF